MLSPETAGLIFQGLSALAFVWVLFVAYRAWQVRSWPTVTGTIIESRTELDVDRNRLPVVKYKYSVRGSEYVSDRILPHGRLATTGGAYAERVLARFPAGRRVAVYVNPANPGDSALERKMPVFVYLLLLAATAAFWWMGGMFRTGRFP